MNSKMSDSAEPKISMEEPMEVHDDFPPDESSPDLQESPPVDLLKIAFGTDSTYQFENAKKRTKKANPYSTDIKTGQTEGIRKIYEPKNTEDILITLCPKCNPKGAAQPFLQKPIFKLKVGEVDVAVETAGDELLVVTYSLVSNGEVFQRKSLTAKRLRKNLIDIVFGRPASVSLHLAIKNSSFGFGLFEKIDRATLDLQLRYFLAFLWDFPSRPYGCCMEMSVSPTRDNSPFID